MPTPLTVVPFAAVAGVAEFFAATGAALQVPNLQHLLALLEPAQWFRLPQEAPLAPHEQALLELAWPEHAHAAAPASLAALTALRHGMAVAEGEGWALVAPGYLHITTDSITLHDPAALQLAPAHNAALREALAALWAEDGLTLHPLPDGRWLAKADWLAGLCTPSADRAVSQDVRAWMPELGATRHLQRLQTEAQMLLYAHPVNDARTAQRLPPVNVLWFSGTGVVPKAPETALTTLPHVDLEPGLRGAALAGDFQSWAGAWQQWDATHGARLLQAVRTGQPIALLLAGERNAVLLQPSKASPLRRWRARWQRWRRIDPVITLLSAL